MLYYSSEVEDYTKVSIFCLICNIIQKMSFVIIWHKIMKNSTIYLDDNFSEYDYEDIFNMIFNFSYCDGKKCTKGLHKYLANADYRAYVRQCQYERTFAILDFIPDNVSLAQILSDECDHINSIRFQRAKRLKKRLHEMLDNSPVCFVTLTFNDDYIDSLSYETKKRYVKDWFQTFQCPYTANVDYGEMNGRIHYHGVVCGIRDDVLLVPWKYGFLHVLQIRNGINDEKRVSKYVAKLSYHSLKDTTKQTKTIYYRNYQRYVKDNDWYIEDYKPELEFMSPEAVIARKTYSDNLGDYFAHLVTFKKYN